MFVRSESAQKRTNSCGTSPAMQNSLQRRCDSAVQGRQPNRCVTFQHRCAPVLGTITPRTRTAAFQNTHCSVCTLVAHYNLLEGVAVVHHPLSRWYGYLEH